MPHSEPLRDEEDGIAIPDDGVGCGRGNARWKTLALLGGSVAAGVLAVIVHSGCMVHQAEERPEPAVPGASGFFEAPSGGQEGLGLTNASWWQRFADPVLDGLQEEAMAANLDLGQLASRIEQADALLRQAGGRLYPQLDATAEYESRWTDLDDSARRRRSEAAAAGALLDWEIDVWGRLRSARRAQRREREAVFFDWLGGRLILSAAVAETYFALVEQRQQLDLLMRQTEANQTLLDLTRLRFGQGQSSIVDVLQQREQLESTRARMPNIEARLRQLGYTLDVLRGRAPGEGDSWPDPILPQPPPLPEPGVPSSLLDHRPDLLAARERVIAVDYQVGEAIADRLPRFAIGGSLLAAGDPSLSSLVASALVSATGPIVDGGIRRAEVARQQARLRESLLQYSQTFLTAVSEVESALVTERKQAETVALLEEELSTAQQLLLETRNRYSQGLTDYLPVLAAVVTVQNLQRELVASRRELLSAHISLHRALGGPMRTAEMEPSATP